MRIFRLTALAVLALFMAGTVSSSASEENGRFEVVLNGHQEQPTAVATDATGQAKFQLDGMKLSFEVDVDDLGEQATAAHIHVITNGVSVGGSFLNGPAVVTLCGAGPAPTQPCGTREDGRLVRGERTLTASTLAAIRNGRTYVNVHTAQFPNGKIRGWVTQPD